MIVKLFTHTDLDGVGNTIIANHARFSEVHTTYCNVNEIDNEVIDFIMNDGLNNYDLVFITDLSVNQCTANEIDFFNCYDKIILLDHHKTSEWMNKYDWALSTTEVNGTLTCGTSLFYDFLVEKELIKKTNNLDKFVEEVRRWDTFDWKTLNDELAHDLNMLLGIVGRNEFVKRFSENISTEFNTHEKLLLDLEKKDYQSVLSKKRKAMVERELAIKSNGLEAVYHVGVVTCEMYTSNIGNDLAEENPQLDFIILVNTNRNTLSFRATAEANVDVSEVAKVFGGGGHKLASGAPINKKKVSDILDILLSLE